MKSTKAEIILLNLSVIWSATFVFTKIGLEFTTPAGYLVIRFAITIILLLAVFGRHLRFLDKTTALHGTVLGVFFGAGFLLQTFALDITTVEKAAFISGLCAVTSPIVDWIMERKPISSAQKIAVIIAVVGLLMLTHPNFSNINYGDLLLLATTFFWSYYLYYMDKFTKDPKDAAEPAGNFSRDANLVIFTFLASMPMMLVSAFALDGGVSAVFSWKLVLSLGFNVIFASIGATFLETRYQKFTTPVRASMIFTFEPVFTSIISYFTFGRPMSLLEMCGGGVMIVGMMSMYILPMMFKKYQPAE